MGWAGCDPHGEVPGQCGQLLAAGHCSDTAFGLRTLGDQAGHKTIPHGMHPVGAVFLLGWTYRASEPRGLSGLSQRQLRCRETLDLG